MVHVSGRGYGLDPHRFPGCHTGHSYVEQLRCRPSAAVPIGLDTANPRQLITQSRQSATRHQLVREVGAPVLCIVSRNAGARVPAAVELISADAQ